jgi:hypothetical protein
VGMQVKFHDGLLTSNDERMQADFRWCKQILAALSCLPQMRKQDQYRQLRYRFNPARMSAM